MTRNSNSALLDPAWFKPSPASTNPLVELVDQQRTIPEALQQRPIQAHKSLPASGRTEVNKSREVVLFQPRLAADQHGSPTGVSGRLANLLTQALGSTGCGWVLKHQRYR